MSSIASFSRAMQPRWFPGYTVAAVATLALVLTAPGQTMLLSLLNLPLREAFGIEPLVLNSAYTVATVAASLPLVWIGSLVDRLGPRRMLMWLAVAFGCACIFMAAVVDVTMVFIAFFLLRFLGQGALSVASHHALAMWFHRRLGVLSGFQTVVIFAVWTALPGATTMLIESRGWRFTWAMFGVVIASTLLPVAWAFVRDRPEELGLRLDGGELAEPRESDAAEPEFTLRQARATPAFWGLALVTTLAPMIGTALMFDIQPLLLERGLAIEDAALAVSVWSATMAVLALPSGRLVDRVAPRWLAFAGTLAIGASCILWLLAESTPGVVVAMILQGAGHSLVVPTVGATAARFFGRRHHGAIRSSLSRMAIFATGLGPLAFGVSHRTSGSYGGALLLFALSCLAGAIASFWVVRPRAGRSG